MFVKFYGFDPAVTHLHRNILPDLEKKYKGEGVGKFIKDVKANAEEVHTKNTWEGEGRGEEGHVPPWWVT